MWKNIEINKQNVVYDTCRATLIKMPNSSKYAGLCFWHPSKLIRIGSNNYSISLSYTNEFIFKLFKKGNGKYNKNEIIEKKEVTFLEIEEAFECMESCTRKKEDNTYLIINEPKKIEKEIEIIEELKNE